MGFVAVALAEGCTSPLGSRLACIFKHALIHADFGFQCLFSAPRKRGAALQRGEGLAAPRALQLHHRLLRGAQSPGEPAPWGWVWGSRATPPPPPRRLRQSVALLPRKLRACLCRQGPLSAPVLRASCSHLFHWVSFSKCFCAGQTLHFHVSFISRSAFWGFSSLFSDKFLQADSGFWTSRRHVQRAQ